MTVRHKTYFSARLEPEDLQSRRDDHTLLLVIGRRNAFKGLEPFHGALSSFGLVRHHAAHCPPENLSGSAEVERSTERLDVASEPQELPVLQLVAVKVTAHVDSFTSVDDDFVSVENRFRHDGGQAAQ